MIQIIKEYTLLPQQIMNINTLDKQVNITIPHWAKHIGVMVSGGMDSALLLYLLLTEITNKNLDVKLTAYNVPNVRDNAMVHSKNLVEYLQSKLDITINLVTIGEGTLPHNQIIMTPAKYIVDNKLVDILYSGANQNPPVQLPAEGPWRRNPSDAVPDHLGFPFIHLYKTHIVEMYRQLDLMDLAYLTHSCTETLFDSCGTCFQCYERAWAMEHVRCNYSPNGYIIPVKFMHNTGGTFLSSWLTFAKYNKPMIRNFSRHGHGHGLYRDVVLKNSHVKFPVQEQIISLLSINYKPEWGNCAYVPCHIPHHDQLVNTFDKVINIYYNQADVHDLTFICLGKWWDDELNVDIKQITREKYGAIKQWFIDSIPKFTKIDRPNVLNIEWRSEIYQGDIVKLSKKLSQFTGIPQTNFDMGAINEWQRLTYYSAQDLRVKF
jgi:7-cyano-7-deazaguanine synthase in queuosine biosynthesis